MKLILFVLKYSILKLFHRLFEETDLETACYFLGHHALAASVSTYIKVAIIW